MPHPSDRSAALRRTLLIDAAASGALGLVLAAGAGALAAPLGLPAAGLRAAGVFLLPFAAALVWVATRPRPPLALAWGVVVGNVAWSVASVWVATGAPVRPTPLGALVVLGQAAAVAAFAWLEYAALRRGGAPAAAGRAA